MSHVCARKQCKNIKVSQVVHLFWISAFPCEKFEVANLSCAGSQLPCKRLCFLEEQEWMKGECVYSAISGPFSISCLLYHQIRFCLLT